MTPDFDKLQQVLKKLPGLGYRSAERLALHLLVEKPGSLRPLVDALEQASKTIQRCTRCGNLAQGDLCTLCSNTARTPAVLCVLERVPDLLSMERSGAFSGVYHVLHGKLSPIQDIGPEQLNLSSLRSRLENEGIQELILALSNDIEGEATCHYIQDEIVGSLPIRVTRLGFGLPSGADVVYADPATLKSALEGRRQF
jgi:recombination protein RecR